MTIDKEWVCLARIGMVSHPIGFGSLVVRAEQSKEH
jgi:hypothetical protein